MLSIQVPHVLRKIRFHQKTSTENKSHNTGSNTISTLISEHIQAISATFFMLIFPFFFRLVMSQQLGLKPLAFITEEDVDVTPAMP